MDGTSTHTEWMADGLQGFYHAERQLVRALQLMGRAASHVVDATETREHAARLQRALQALLASASDTLRTGNSQRPFPASDAELAASSPECVKQYKNAAMDSVHAFAHTLGQDQVVELLEHPEAARRVRRIRRTNWPAPIKPAVDRP